MRHYLGGQPAPTAVVLPGQVLNAHYAQKRATDYLRAYCDPSFVVDPPYEEWETELHDPPPLRGPG